MPYGTYYVDDYSGSDYAKITAAVNAAHSAGGGRVALSNRTYSISQSIVLHSNIVFCGVGTSSLIVCTADVPHIQILSANNDSSYIEIKDMSLFYADMETTSSFHVEAEKPLYLQIRRVSFLAEHRNYSGVLTWDGVDREQKIFADSEHAAFMTHIENCLFNSGCIWLNDSDSRIINNYVWANAIGGSVIRMAIRLSNGAVNVSGNDIVSGCDAGIYLASTCSGIRIENNYFDGSWHENGVNVRTGWGIWAEGAARCLVVGNSFNDSFKGGIL